jgi:hypothetical protein
MKTLTLLVFILFSWSVFGQDTVELSFAALPDFAYNDETLLLPITVLNNVERPPKSTDANFISVKLKYKLGHTTKEVKSLSVPKYNSSSTSYPISADFSALKHKDILTLTLQHRLKTVMKQAIVFSLTDDIPLNIKSQMGHFEYEGKRVIFVMPRATEKEYRRWLPAKKMKKLINSDPKGMEAKNTVLLLGAEYNDGRYIQALKAKMQANDPACQLEVACSSGQGVAIFQLLLTVIKNRNNASATAIVFPGINDLRFSTPSYKYMQALQAISCVLQSGANKRQIVLVTPPPYFANQTRWNHYRQLVIEVARQRHLHLLDLQEIKAKVTASDKSELYCGASGQAALVECLAQAIQVLGGRSFWLSAVLILFVLVSLGLMWLWLRARYSVPHNI